MKDYRVRIWTKDMDESEDSIQVNVYRESDEYHAILAAIDTLGIDPKTVWKTEVDEVTSTWWGVFD